MTDGADSSPLYKAAFPFADDVLALPVQDIDRAAEWYGARFGLVETERRTSPTPTVIMERDGVRIGFAVNGGDPSQEGAAILVTDIARARDELKASGVKAANWRVDERDGRKYQVFFVVAPDGLCYYFHQPLRQTGA
ncbi:MAG: VOC family protein [Acidobacteria bacterium]|nr:VOC family protein [Acidobacteriota bacterium]MYD70997.1 VOC family protein [Acidobacteriota bacterium]MYJ02925.1 VOC family protein [Acidobacteriota bacterium]